MRTPTGYTKAIDFAPTATPTGGCLNGSTFSATRSIHPQAHRGSGWTARADAEPGTCGSAAPEGFRARGIC